MISRLYTCLLLAGLCLMANACGNVCNMQLAMGAEDKDGPSSEAPPPPLPVETNNCLEDMFYKAEVRPAYAQRYAELFRQNGMDARNISGLEFEDLVTLLKMKELNITHSGDALNIHRCLQAPNGRCVEDPFCINNGQCVYSKSTSSHTCDCPSRYTGVRCERKASDKVTALEDCIKEMACVADNLGVTYTRWGKNSCNETAGAELVYNGYAAGSWYTHRGGGANLQCLPYEPKHGEYRPGVQSHGLLFSAEFEVTNTNFEPWDGLHNHDATCSVCRVRGRSNKIMIPARNVCPPAWTLEYHGYLMTSHKAYQRLEHVCVDVSPDAARGTFRDTNGELLYFVEANCDLSIDCYPYEAQKELTCAVCTI